MNTPSHGQSSSPPPRWWHGLATGPLVAVAWLFRKLPAAAAYLIADAVAVCLLPYGLLRDPQGRRSGGFHRNVRLAFRGTPPPPGLMWRNARHLAWLAVDLARMPLVTRANLDRHVETRGMERLAPILAREGREAGLICVTGHIGSPEYLGHVMALLGHRATGVYAPSPVPGINRLGDRLRSAGGQRLVPPQGVMWSLKKALDRGELVGVAADTSNKENPVYAPFLGTFAATSAMPGLLHLSTGKPIAVCTMERLGRMRFRMHVWDVFEHPRSGDRDRDLLAISTRINDSLSRAILARPEQWFWHSRRFRRRPPGEMALPDGQPPVAQGEHPAFWRQPDRAGAPVPVGDGLG